MSVVFSMGALTSLASWGVYKRSFEGPHQWDAGLCSNHRARITVRPVIHSGLLGPVANQSDPGIWYSVKDDKFKHICRRVVVANWVLKRDVEWHQNVTYASTK